jgi:hypothetical protein
MNDSWRSVFTIHTRTSAKDGTLEIAAAHGFNSQGHVPTRQVFVTTIGALTQ